MRIKRSYYECSIKLAFTFFHQEVLKHIEQLLVLKMHISLKCWMHVSCEKFRSVEAKHIINKLFQLAMVLHEALSRRHTEKYTKGDGQLLVAGKRLTLGVRGPGEKPSWGGTKSSDIEGSYPGQGS